MFSLVANDGTADSSADTVSITVSPPANTAPTANAGGDQTVASAASVTLDGSGTSDIDVGDVLTYAWTQTSGTTVALTGATTAQPSFTAPTLGHHSENNRREVVNRLRASVVSIIVSA